MDKYFEISIGNFKKKLKLCRINDDLYIAGFIMFGEVELTIECARLLLEAAPDFDVLVTAESKGIPLVYEMSKQSGKKYFVARKNKKLYMDNPISVDVKSITTSFVQTLYLDQSDINLIKGKRVLIVDDVISTGESIKTLQQLILKAEGIISGISTVLAEGDAANRDDIYFLSKLPLFNSKGEALT